MSYDSPQLIGGLFDGAPAPIGLDIFLAVHIDRYHRYIKLPNGDFYHDEIVLIEEEEDNV